jgi:hypothetical protein
MKWGDQCVEGIDGSLSHPEVAIGGEAILILMQLFDASLYVEQISLLIFHTKQTGLHENDFTARVFPKVDELAAVELDEGRAAIRHCRSVVLRHS